MTEQPGRCAEPRAKRAEPLPFDPDPDLVGHLEGNRRSIRNGRKHVIKMRDQARAEEAARMSNQAPV